MINSMQICLAISALRPRALSYFSNSSSTLRWSAFSRAMASWAGIRMTPYYPPSERQDDRSVPAPVRFRNWTNLCVFQPDGTEQSDAMPRALKVFKTHIGFHDLIVAAPSMKAAAAAWEASPRLFAQGFAEQTN